MQAGDLRERLTFQQRIVISDGYGNERGDFEDEFTVAANVRPRLGGESILQSRLAGTNLVNITVRYSSDTLQITPAWRAYDVRTGRLYNLRSAINPDERKRFIEILAEASDIVVDPQAPSATLRYFAARYLS